MTAARRGDSWHETASLVKLPDREIFWHFVPRTPRDGVGKIKGGAYRSM